MVTVDELKAYLRIDTDEEDTLLEHCLKAAWSYLQDAVTDFEILYSVDTDYTAKADMLIKVLAGEMWQNRDSRNDSRDDYSFIVRSMINQLQYRTVDGE